MKTKEDYESEILDIIKTKDWSRARASKNRNLYVYIQRHKNTDENCRIISEHIKPRDHKSEILEIIETEDWDRAKQCNDINLHQYIYRNRNTDESCRIVWEHVNQQSRDYKLEVLGIIETEDWNRARYSNDKSLYNYILAYRDTDENCKIIWEHIKPRDYKSEILEIIETKDWNRVRQCNDKYLYNYIFSYKDTDENCKIVWEHMTKKHCPYTIKDYLLYYFKHEKSTKISNKSLYIWFIKEIKNNNRCCTDIKNLIIAANTYKDPVALETLELIKSHLEKEGV